MARRKNLRKTGYYELANCFGRNKTPGWQQYLPGDKPLTLELGCGKADFSYELALRHPDEAFLGIDLKPDRMWYAATRALEQQVPNIAFLQIHLLELPEFVPPACADTIWITFPDPFPKKRQAKHRMTNPPFLDLYRRILKPGGSLCFKTDNLDLFHYSLEVLVRYPGVQFQALSFDLHADEALPPDTRIETAYEKQFRALGQVIKYVQVRFEAHEAQREAGGLTS
ncbi:MAG: tRNA (guanosine(46)-N7)-methyltransferase TrmB [Bacteroidia bacterium]|nr:tRNA (guanosine(46)-N7)-methyltransferase TrmB [Bacteroidia bacterium]